MGTDVGLQGTIGVETRVELRLHLGSEVLVRQETVAPGSQVILRDLVDLLGASGQGPLEVVADHALRVSSRVYNEVAADAACTPSGTFGQGFRAYSVDEGLEIGQEAWLPQLTESSAFRTNIALTTIGEAPARAAVELYDGEGAELASFEVSLAAGERKQETCPFSTRAGAADLDPGYARIEVT